LPYSFIVNLPGRHRQQLEGTQ